MNRIPERAEVRSGSNHEVPIFFKAIIKNPTGSPEEVPKECSSMQCLIWKNGWVRGGGSVIVGLGGYKTSWRTY